MEAEDQSQIHDHDLHWKLVIEALFKDFIAYFLPKLFAKVDFSKKPAFLEKEFHRLVYKKSRKGKGFVDKLIDIPMLRGVGRMLLLHAEIQSGKSKEGLPKRMFRYFYLIREKFDREVTAIAIYAHKNVPEPHNQYHYKSEGVKLSYEFNSFLVSAKTEAELLADPNPFALVILACKYINDSMTDAGLRVNLKLKLVELAFQRGYSQKQVDGLLTFIEFMLILPEDKELEYIVESRKIYEKINIMPATEARKQWADYIYKLVHGNSVQDLLEQEQAKVNLLKQEQVKVQDLLEQEQAKVQDLLKQEQAKQNAQQLELAIKLLKMGLPMEKVVDLTGFAISRLKEIKKEYC